MKHIAASVAIAVGCYLTAAAALEAGIPEWVVASISISLGAGIAIWLWRTK